MMIYPWKSEVVAELFCTRSARDNPSNRKLVDLKHLQKYSIALEAIVQETTEGNSDAYYLAEAIEVIRNLQNVAQLRTF